MLHRVDQDVGFWLELARSSGGPVLELACGTGRLTVPLAEAGVEVVGLDHDPVMLFAAQRRGQLPKEEHLPKAEQLPKAPFSSDCGRAGPVLVAADMRRFAFGRLLFHLIFVGYNSLQLLTGEGDISACLQCARSHLAPGGVIGVEVTDFQYDDADDADDAHGSHGPDSFRRVDGPEARAGLSSPESSGSARCDDPDRPDRPGDDNEFVTLADAEGIRLSGALDHNLAQRTSTYRRRFQGDDWAIEDEVLVRSLNRPELEALFGEAGLAPITWWTDGATIRAIAAPRP